MYLVLSFFVKSGGSAPWERVKSFLRETSHGLHHGAVNSPYGSLRNLGGSGRSDIITHEHLQLLRVLPVFYEPMDFNIAAA